VSTSVRSVSIIDVCGRGVLCQVSRVSMLNSPLLACVLVLQQDMRFTIHASRTAVDVRHCVVCEIKTKKGRAANSIQFKLQLSECHIPQNFLSDDLRTVTPPAPPPGPQYTHTDQRGCTLGGMAWSASLTFSQNSMTQRARPSDAQPMVTSMVTGCGSTSPSPPSPSSRLLRYPIPAQALAATSCADDCTPHVV
jgi:hypothetical protein